MSGTTSGVEFSQTGEDTHMRIFRGKTLRFEVIWGGATPIDVTGYQASLQIRDTKGGLLLELSTSNGKIVAGGVDGKFTFAGTAEDSRAVASVSRWELELTTPDGEIHRALSGIVTPVEEYAL